MKKSIFPLSIIVLSVAGLLFSYILAEEFHFISAPQFKGSTPGFFYKMSTQVCGDEGSYFSCANVSKSPYSRLMGLPVAIYGVCFYLIALFVGMGFGFAPRRVQPAAGVFLYWSAKIGVIIDITLLVVSVVYINSICPFCLATYITNFLLFGIVIAYLIIKRINPFRLIRLFKEIDPPNRKLTIALFALTITVILFSSAGIAYEVNDFLIASRTKYINENKDKEIASIVAEFAKQEAKDIHPSTLHVYGPPDAPVTIIEFSDFLCPFCAYISTVMDQLVEENPGKIRLLFVNYPLDIACNKYMQRPMHKGACELATGAVCASRLGGMANYQKAAFQARKHGLTNDDFTRILIESGVSPNDFFNCIRDPETIEFLEKQIDEAKSYGINATPTIYINNKRFKGRLYKEALQEIIDLEYERVTGQ